MAMNKSHAFTFSKRSLRTVLIDDGSVCTEGWGECIKAIDVANRQKRKREFFFKHEP